MEKTQSVDKLARPESPVNVALARDNPEYVRALLRSTGVSEEEIERVIEQNQSRDQ